MSRLYRLLIVPLALLLVPCVSLAERIGEVDTAWKMIGPNHKIVIEAFDDPGVPGATCYLSRAVTGGISGAIGVAEDTSDASIACRQTGPINASVVAALKPGEQVFKQSTSLLFKSMQVVRHYDQQRRVITYLVYSDKLIDGSPKSSISVIPIRQFE
ncbi:MAG: CreA family protein [Pseudomonadota bacterium]